MRKSKGAHGGEADGGNVTTIDLGEKIDAAIRHEATRMAGTARNRERRGRPGVSRFSGGYRPGMYGGYRGYQPWHARHRAGLSGGGDWKLGKLLDLPEDVKKVGPDLLTGALIGTVGNRVVTWIVPGVVKSNNNLLTQAIGFGVGLVPFLAKRNATTVGIALPGLIFLAGALTETGLEKLNILGPKPVLSGAKQGVQNQDALGAARRKLAEVQARMHQARQRAAQPGQGPRRVVARPRSA